MTNTTWQQQFEHDFRTKVFKGMSREETTQEAVKYFTDFIESKVKDAERRGEDNMKCRVQCLLDDNDDYQMFEWAFKKL